MGCQPPVELGALGTRDGKRLRPIGDAVPDGLNELDALFDAEAQELLKLARAHVGKSTQTVRSTQISYA